MKVVAWMDERHAWRSPRAPTKVGTYALVLADDHEAALELLREIADEDAGQHYLGSDMHARIRALIAGQHGDE